jgi:peptidoglycan/xylan/chitin deacetylase (PgdA/CDA1 family)
VRAERIKQVLKNSVYRTLGETAAAIGANANGHRSLRVLMYHKVNDLPGNPLTMPVSLFDEQMDQLRDLGYTVVGLEAVLDHYVEGKPLPEHAVLITFDDGYYDNLDNAARVLRKYGYPGVLFVPIGYLGDRFPLPHEEHLAAQGILNRTIDWDELVELEREGIRIESHGISHRPRADREVDEAARELALSKLRLEERLGRPVRAFSYVKGSEAHYKAVHLSLVRQAGYDLAFTAVSGANSAATDPLQLRRYNIEPYSPRTFELVLAGACDLISLKDTVTGTHARRIFNAALGTSTK